MMDIIIKIFLTQILLAQLIMKTEACSCIIAHPQQKFCMADFVIMVTPRSEIEPNEPNGYRIYNVDPVTVLMEKDSQVSWILNENKQIFTAAQSATCGVTLQINTTYIVSGYLTEGPETLSLHINSCGYIAPYCNVPFSILLAIKIKYQCGCDCNMLPCPAGSDCKADENTCLWDYTNENRAVSSKYMCYRCDGKCKWTELGCVICDDPVIGD